MSDDASTAPETGRLHATCVALDGRGVLLRGPAGAGKSDLALRLIAGGHATLVSDDQCLLRREGDRVVAHAPESIAGRIEVRGVGIVQLPHTTAEVDLLVDLVPRARVERLPEPASERVLGVEIPRAELDPFDASAVAKLSLVLGRGRVPIMASAADRSSGRSEGARAEMSQDEAAVQEAAPAEPEPDARPSAQAGGAIKLVVVTGVSGAGRSTTLKALEDVGYEAIDNLPLHLIPAIAHEGSLTEPIAVGVDIRTRNFAAEPFLDALAQLRRHPALSVTLLFVDCEDEVLQRRYTETRRRHPLAQGRPVSDGIAAERRLVEPLRREADMTIDTSTLSVHDLRRVVAAQLGLGTAPEMAIFVTSFSFKNGVPREADLVFDVRFLKNPHYEDALRPLTGRERAVAEFVESDPDYAPFLEGLTAMMQRLVPRYEQEGKSYLTIAFGCTGGRHRSVALAERLARALEGQGRRVILSHRELDRDGDNGADTADTKDAQARDSR